MIEPSSNNVSLKTGLSLFLAGSLFCYVGKKYYKIKGCDLKFQIRAFAIAGIGQSAISSLFFENPTRKFVRERGPLFWTILYELDSIKCQCIPVVVLTMIVVGRLKFERPLLKIAMISFGCLATDRLLEAATDRLLVYLIKKNISEEVFKRLWLPVHVGGNLNLTGCTNLAYLPAGLRVGGDLNLCICTNLTSLPAGLRVGFNLNINGCTRLTSLPEGLSVGRDLDLVGCRSLTSLPEGTRIGGNLDLESCTSLTSLPEELHVGGGWLNLEGCTSLTTLPNWITTMGPQSDGSTRTVNLTGTRISDTIIDRLRETPAPGMQFQFSRAAAAIDETTFYSLDRALQFWSDLSEARALPRLALDGNASATMAQFLGRLANTAEYQNVQTREPLAGRILKMISFLSEDEDTKTKALDLIHGGLVSCDDRVIATLDEVELLQKIHDAEKDSPSLGAEQKLKDLGLALYKLEEVRRYARLHMAGLQWVDEVEVQLAFQIGLTQRLRLPLSTQNMIFRGCAAVSDQQIFAVGQRVLTECTEERVNEFLASWDPWTRHTRRKAIPAYQNIQADPSPVNGPIQCEILSDDTLQPVRHNQNIFDYDTLCKIYVESGKNPCTNVAISWDDVRRLETSEV